MDILNFIKMQRKHTTSLYGLLTENQKKFSEALSIHILSEFSTDNDKKSEEEEDSQFR